MLAMIMANGPRIDLCLLLWSCPASYLLLLLFNQQALPFELLDAKVKAHEEGHPPDDVLPWPGSNVDLIELAGPDSNQASPSV